MADISDRKLVYAIIILLTVFLQVFGIVDFPSLVIKTVEKADYNLNGPNEMDLNVGGINYERCSILWQYCGYHVETTIVNVGSPGFANIRCDVYSLNGSLIKQKEIYPPPHFERNKPKEFKFYFDPTELPDEKYNFNITIHSPLKDS